MKVHAIPAVLFLLNAACGESRPPLLPPAAVLEGKPGVTPEGKTLPEVWCVVRGYDSGNWVEKGSFIAREKAELEAKKPGAADAQFAKVVKDSPKERYRVDGRDIADDVCLTLRENWLKRHDALIAPFASLAKDAYIFTWTTGDSDQILRARHGGPAPRRRGDAWPVCGKCRKPMVFVGSIDFRDTPLREGMPGDAATLHRCTTVGCPYDLDCSAVTWLKAGEDLVLMKAPPGTPVQPTELGTRWLLKDYPWSGGLDAVEPPESEQNTYGHSPYFHVTLYGTKAGGIIFWIQDDETPTCACGEKMRFVGQIDSAADDAMGLLYLFRCAKGKCADAKAVLQPF